jgi:phosphoglycolate phosphatase
MAACTMQAAASSSDASVCRDDFPEEEAKPNGKAMVRIAGMMGLRPEDCVLVGDHAMDLKCARSAPSGFVGVLSGSFKSEDWSRHGCDMVIDNVGMLPRLLLEQKS